MEILTRSTDARMLLFDEKCIRFVMSCLKFIKNSKMKVLLQDNKL